MMAVIGHWVTQWLAVARLAVNVCIKLKSAIAAYPDFTAGCHEARLRLND